MTQYNQHLQRERERVNSADKIFSYKNLLKCYYECRKRKRYTVNALKFELNFENELLKLQKELTDHTYKPGKSICFVVTKPKLREIFAADFRDRIVHHVLVGYLEPIFEKKFIDQSYACRKGKGAHKTIEDLKRYIRKVTIGNIKQAHYLQVDIQSFFVSLKKDILFDLVKKQVKNPEILWLSETIIFHNPTRDYYQKGQMSLFGLIPDHKSLFKVPQNQGLPIGNLTSQFFANVYLDELDQFAKHILKIKYYLRYVDDIVILSEDGNQLKFWRGEIDKFLRDKLKLRLHPKKQILQGVDKGVDFVGFVVRPDYVLARRRIVKSLKEKLRNFNNDFELRNTLNCHSRAGGNPESASNTLDPRIREDDRKEGFAFKNNDKRKPTQEKANKILSAVNSYYGQFKHSNTFGLRRKLWQHNFGELRKFLEPVDKNLSYFNANLET